MKRWWYVQRLRGILKQRFKKEYLGFLWSSVPKKCHKIKIGDIVLIRRDDKKWLYYPLAKGTELFSTKDKIVRLVKLETSKETY